MLLLETFYAQFPNFEQFAIDPVSATQRDWDETELVSLLLVFLELTLDLME